MKEGSDNFRDSAIFDVIKYLKKEKVDFVAYEPLWKSAEFEGIRLENNLKNFKKNCDLIIANRIHEEIKDVKDKIFSRDIFIEN